MFDEKKAVVQAYLDQLGGTESNIWTAIETHWHPHAYWKLIGTTARSGTHKGLEAIKRDFMEVGRRGDGRDGPSVQGLSSEYPVTMTIDEIVAMEDGRVVVFCQSDARGRNGLPYQNEYCWIFEVEGDKIAGLVEFCDTVPIEVVHFDKKLVPRGTSTPVYQT